MDTRKPIKEKQKLSKPAETYHRFYFNSYLEAEAYQKEFNYNQARINFELNEIDKVVITTLHQIVEMLQKVNDLKTIDLGPIVTALNKVCERSNTVASIKPPGCEPGYSPEE